jgi:DNA-binding protein YbaB
MLDQLKAVGALAGLLKDRDKLQKMGERIQARLEQVRATGSAQGGAINAVVTGRMRVVSIDLGAHAALASPADRALTQKMIADAINDALAKAELLAKDAALEEAKANGLPDLPALTALSGFLGR